MTFNLRYACAVSSCATTGGPGCIVTLDPDVVIRKTAILGIIQSLILSGASTHVVQRPSFENGRSADSTGPGVWRRAWLCPRESIKRIL